MESANRIVRIATRREPLLLVLPALLLLVIGFAIPVASMLVSSVTEAGGIKGLTLDNYQRFFETEFYLRAGLRSLKLSLIQTAVCLALAIPLAYIMARAGSRLRTALLVLVILPLMTSVVVRTFGWVVLMAPNGLLGGNGQGLLGTETGIIIAMVQVLLPFAVLTILGVITGIDAQLEEAARTMGASFWSTMRHVVIPLAAPGILAGGTLVFALSISSFITPNLIGGARLPVLASTIYTDATVNLDWPFAAAQSVVLLAAVLVALMATARLGRGRK